MKYKVMYTLAAVVDGTTARLYNCIQIYRNAIRDSGKYEAELRGVMRCRKMNTRRNRVYEIIR